MRSALVNRVLMVVGLVGSVSAYASQGDLKPYQYWVRVPATPASCEDEAARLASRFEAATHSAQVKGTCKGAVDAHFDGQVARLYSIQVDYVTDNPTPIYSAQLGAMNDDFSNSIDRGSYPSYAACLSDLGNQSAAFEHETGLIAVAAFCEPDAIEETQFNMQIDGFGTPKKALHIFHLNFGADDVKKNEAVQKLLESQGAHIVRSVGGASLYYSESWALLRQETFGLFNQESECQAQMDAVSNLYLATGSKSRDSMVITCDLEEISGGAYVLYGVADGYGVFETTQVPQKYYSFDECMQDRDRQIQSNSYGRQTGALCTPSITSGGIYEMQLYRQ